MEGVEGERERDGLLRYVHCTPQQREREREEFLGGVAAGAAWILPSFVRSSPSGDSRGKRRGREGGREGGKSPQR